jgi:hypothetical protein
MGSLFSLSVLGIISRRESAQTLRSFAVASRPAGMALCWQIKGGLGSRMHYSMRIGSFWGLLCFSRSCQSNAAFAFFNGNHSHNGLINLGKSGMIQSSQTLHPQ